MSCECNKYGPVELDRKSIRKRINESKSLKQRLEAVAEYQEDYNDHNLYRCAECGQLWQESYAWNFGAKWYLFQVPHLSVEEWLTEQYVQPDHLLMYWVGYVELMAQNYEPTDYLCREEGCENLAIRLHILCREHYWASQLKIPRGRIFPPYSIG